MAGYDEGSFKQMGVPKFAGLRSGFADPDTVSRHWISIKYTYQKVRNLFCI